MTRAIIEDGLQLEIHRMVARTIADGATRFSGRWQWSRDGESYAVIGYWVDVLADHSARLRLHYSADGQPVDDTVQLVGLPCRFGGRRWYAICPRTGRRASKLYKPCGALHFLSRHVWRLAYRSQNAAKGMDRLCRSRDRILFRKLKSDDPDLPMKPKWMRWKTYDRHVGRIEDLHARMDGAMIQRFGQLAGL